MSEQDKPLTDEELADMLLAAMAEPPRLSDAELEGLTGEPHIDGWPLYSGLPPSPELPALPAAGAFSLTRSIYTADDMREYARAAIAADRAAQAEAHAAEMARMQAEFDAASLELQSIAARVPVLTDEPAQSLTMQMQQMCCDWGTYWRAPDAHGVDLSHEQALELLRFALGVEVAIAADRAARVPGLTDGQIDEAIKACPLEGYGLLQAWVNMQWTR